MKRRMALLLTLMMVMNLFVPFASHLSGARGVSFAEVNPKYEYETEGQSGDKFYFPEDKDAVEADKRNVFFTGIQPGHVVVQDYNVSKIGWMSGYEDAWYRDNMYQSLRVKGKPYAITAELNEGYGSSPNIYDTSYLFFKKSNWTSGDKQQGGLSKTARRVWGYYTPSATGYYKFQIESDDGHYMNFYDDDIFYDPKYDYYDDGSYEKQWNRFYENGICYYNTGDEVLVTVEDILPNNRTLNGQKHNGQLEWVDGSYYYYYDVMVNKNGVEGYLLNIDSDRVKVRQNYYSKIWTIVDDGRNVDAQGNNAMKVIANQTGNYIITSSNHPISKPALVDTTKVQETMRTSGGISSNTAPIYMTEGEVYPFFIEYFNWGGGGWFEFKSAYSPDSIFDSSEDYETIDTERLHPEVSNIPREPGNSGLDLKVIDGVRIIHGYDNFNSDELDTTKVWKDNTGFFVDNRVLKSTGGVSTLKLKELTGDYGNYDSYDIRIDLVNLTSQDLGYPNGGIGITGDGDIWSHHTKVTQGTNNNKWYRNYGISKVNSITTANPQGVLLVPFVEFGEMQNADENWKNRSIRIAIKAVKSLTEADAYDVTTTLYHADDLSTPIKIIQETYSTSQLDFESIFLTSIQPTNTWRIAFDNFDFVAKKNLKFDSLKVRWKDHEYKLYWDLVPGATSYVVNYQTGIDENGKPIIKKYSDSAVTLKDGYIYIDDDHAACEHLFSVVANMNGYGITSNSVYVGGNTDPLNISGGYKDSSNDYVVNWGTLSGATLNNWTVVPEDKVVSYEFSLFYEDELGQILPVEGAQNIASTESTYTFKNLLLSSKYYDKNVRVVATVDFGEETPSIYYSEWHKIKEALRLGISHVDDHYVLGWNSSADFTSYKLYRNGNENNLSDYSKIQLANPLYETIKNTIENKERNGYIYKKYPDDLEAYMNKYYAALGIYGINHELSNRVRSYGNETVPTLVWVPQADGTQLYKLGTFNNADSVKLYYGDHAYEINNDIDGSEKLLGLDDFITSHSDSQDKFVQAVFTKNGIDYYTNIVRTKKFDDLGGTITNNTIDPSKYDFTLTWDDIHWPQDTTITNGISSYQLYYINDLGEEVLIERDLRDNTITIEDIYGDNKVYLDKEILVKAVSSIKDKFGMVYEAVLVSPTITPRKMKFDGLDGNLDGDMNYTITWDALKKLVNGVEEDVLVDNYNIKYGATKKTITDIAVNYFDPSSGLVKTWTKLDSAPNDAFYHKFFKVEATVDGVTYLSNTAYSGEAPVLKIKRFGDDFVLDWNSIEHADAIRVYYSKKENDDNFIHYADAILAGNSTQYTLEKMLSDSDFNNKYYRVAAVFDGFEIPSNTVHVDVRKALPVLTGKYNAKTSAFDTSWTPLEWSNDGYQFYYENELTDTSDEDDENYKKLTIGGNDLLMGQSDKAYNFESVESNPYRGKYVRIQAIDGNFTAYSNAVFVEKPAFDGSLVGYDEGVDLKLSDDIEVSYVFQVYKDMIKPYFEMDLKGTKFINFENLSASLERTDNGTTVELPIRLVTQLDDETGLTKAYVHYSEGDATFKENSGSYKLTLFYSVEVNKMRAKSVYDALRVAVTSAENWELPYNIYNVKQNEPQTLDKMLKVGEDALASDMHMSYELHWNSDRKEEGETRQAHQELFNVDVKMINKAKLPSSL